MLQRLLESSKALATSHATATGLLAGAVAATATAPTHPTPLGAELSFYVWLVAFGCVALWALALCDRRRRVERCAILGWLVAVLLVVTASMPVAGWVRAGAAAAGLVGVVFCTAWAWSRPGRQEPGQSASRSQFTWWCWWTTVAVAAGRGGLWLSAQPTLRVLLALVVAVAVIGPVFGVALRSESSFTPPWPGMSELMVHKHGARVLGDLQIYWSSLVVAPALVVSATSISDSGGLFALSSKSALGLLLFVTWGALFGLRVQAISPFGLARAYGVALLVLTFVLHLALGEALFVLWASDRPYALLGLTVLGLTGLWWSYRSLQSTSKFENA